MSKGDFDGFDLEDTTKDLEALTYDPREFKWRDSVARNFIGVRKELYAIKLVALQTKTAVEKSISRTDVVKIAEQQFQGTKDTVARIEKVQDRLIWSVCVTLVVMVIGGVSVAVILKATGVH